MKNKNLLNLVGRESYESKKRVQVVSVSLASRWRVLGITMLCLLTLGVGNAWGATATNNCGSALSTSYTDMESGKQIEWKVSSENKFSSPIRVYASTTITIHAKTGYKITKVVVTASSTGNYVTYTQNATWAASGSGDCSVSARTVSSKDITANITGTANTVTISPSSQTRWSQVVVTYESAGKTDPTASFSNGTYTIGGDALNLSSLWTSNSDGAVTYTVTSAGGTGASISTASFTATTAGSCTVKASQAATASYNAIEKSATITVQNPTCATPTFSPVAGAYLGTQSVTISCATGGSNIYYTTNGSTPTTSSTLYSGAISVSSTTTIQAIATKSGYANSTVASATYTITPAYTVTWKNQGSTVTTTNVASGSKPVFPDMSLQSGCQTYTYFYGWAEDTWTGEVASPGTSSTVKVYKSASEMPNVTGDGVVYHAVWGDSPGGWAAASSVSVGDVIVITDKNDTKELTGIYMPSSTYIGKAESFSTTPNGTYPLTVVTGYNSSGVALKNGNDYLLGSSSNDLSKTTTLSALSSWTLSYDGVNDDWSITNNDQTSRKIRFNGSASPNRFCTYTSAQTGIHIWKHSAAANCVTSCCNQLAAINGSVSSYTETSVTLQWDKLSNVDGTTPYTVTCSPAGTVGSIDLSGAKATCTVTGLSCGTSYTFSITAHGTTGYCDKTQSGIAQTTSSYTVGYSVTNGSKTSGDATTCGPLTAVFSANSGYHLPDKAAITVTGASDFSWTKATGTLTITAGQITGNINISFTCPADACTDAFSLHTGTKGGSDWLYNKCFSDADWGAVDDAIWVGEFPSTNECYVGYAGGDSYHGAYWAVGGIKTYNIPNGRTLGWNGSDYYSDYPATALGTFHIYKNSTDENYYLRFKPTSYVLRTGSDGTSWTSRDMTVSGINSNYYESDFVTLTSTLISEHAYVDLKANNGDGHVWCNFSNDRTASGNVKVKNGASTFRATDLQASDNGTYGKFQIDITQDVDNWKLAFVPYFHITYNANGGTGSTAASSYVEVGSTAAAAANGFTAPTGKQFGGWATSAGGSKAYDPTDAVTLNSNVELFAVWTDINYTVTVNQNPSVGATTTGQTTTAHYNGTINLTTTVPSGYRFVNWTTSDGFSITNPTSATTASFTMPNKNVTVTANFVQTHTVTWSVNGATASSVTYDHGAALVLPTPDPSAPSGCSSKTFIGWTTHAEISSEVHDKPTLLNPASPGTVAGDVTYRAVFADEVTGKTTVTRYLYTTSISTGKNYIIASSNSAGSVNTATYPGSGNAFTNTSMTVVSGTPNYIAAPANNNAVWSVATGSASGKYHIQNVGTSGNYIRINGSAANISTDATDVYFDSDHGVFGKSGSGSTSYSFYYSSGWTKGTFSTSNRNYIFEATEVEVETTTTDNYITLCSTCTTPSNVTASSISSTGATISWEGVSIEQQPGGSGTGFVVKYGTNATRDLNSNTVNATSSESSKALTGLTPATQYYAWVQAKCDNSWSETPASFHTAAKITYDKNGGTGTNTSEDVTYNSNVTIKTIATLGFEAPSGKTFNGWLSSSAVTVGGSSTTSVADGATISNLTVAITLTAQWRDLASYTVHYSANNGTIVGGADQIVYENGTLTFPNVTPTCGAFVGWIESSSYSSGTKPSGATFHLAGDEIAVTDALDGKTYYAVYAEETAPEPTEDYVLIENEQNDWSGDYLIVVSYDDSGTPRNRAFDGSLATLDATSNYQDVMITSKTITSNSTTDGYKFTIAKVVGQPGKYSILSAHGEYMGSDASNTASKPNEIDQNSTLTAALYNTISYNSTESRPEILGSHATNPMILTFNKTAGQVRFRYMTSVSTAIQLYKKGGGSTYTYKTSPSCSPTVSTSTPASSFTYVYDNGPSASQTFQVSGSNLSANLNVAAPSNYEVSADNISFSSSINITPTDGRVATTTVYIRLAAGLNVGSYNGGVITVSSTGADDDVSAALTGSVTKAAGAIAFTDFNAVDHYEAEMSKGGTSLDVTLTVSVTGDGAVSYSRSPAAGSSAVPATTPTTTLHVTTVGTWTVTANLAAGTNYTNASTNCQVVVYYADRFYDNLHGNSTIVKRNDTGEDHYTIPSLSDESRLTSGSCSETHYHFMGWVPESALSTLSNDAAYDAVMITGGGTQAASGTNYYAVWAEE